MQRPLLLLALAAVAVLGIAGLLAAPGGENPSAGDGTTAPATEATTITLGRVAGSSAQVAVLGGVLRASDGRPVANRPVELD